MAKSKKIAIIGHFGGHENFLDGQTVKTKILYQELTETTQWKIQKVDTYYKKKNPFRLLWQMFSCLLTTKDVIVLLSSNGKRFCFPLLSFWSRAFGLRVYHDVIGGNLASYVEKSPKFGQYLRSFAVNWVETYKMKAELETLQITNVDVIPNFKRLNCVTEDTLQKASKPPFRFCTFSRVMKEKGIDDAIAAIEAVNTQAKEELCSLDIYGRVDPGYQERFDALMKDVSPAVRYCGTVPFDQSVETIRQYYALLFPTYWKGEGFAGTIVDAFSAGLPVIASRWGSNDEIVKDGVYGLLYPSEKIETLTQAVQWAITHPQKIDQMRSNVLAAAKDYQPDVYIQKIIEFIQNKQ